MPMGLSRLFSKGRRKASEEGAPAAEAVVVAPEPQHRIGLWVLSTFAVIAALVAISAVVIGPGNADLKLVIPLALFWSVTVCVGFAIRAALVNVIRSFRRKPAAPEAEAATPRAAGGFLSRRREEKPDATLERLARMAQRERNRELTHPHLARTLVHAG